MFIRNIRLIVKLCDIWVSALREVDNIHSFFHLFIQISSPPLPRQQGQSVHETDWKGFEWWMEEVANWPVISPTYICIPRPVACCLPSQPIPSSSYVLVLNLFLQLCHSCNPFLSTLLSTWKRATVFPSMSLFVKWPGWEDSGNREVQLLLLRCFIGSQSHWRGGGGNGWWGRWCDACWGVYVC